MPGKGIRVIDWNGDAVMFRLKNATEKACKAVALQIEAQAKANIAKPFPHKGRGRKTRELLRGQIDTGAMLNATQATFKNLPPNVIAAVISSQEYAPYQEAIRPFFQPAIDTVKPQAAKAFADAGRKEGLL